MAYRAYLIGFTCLLVLLLVLLLLLLLLAQPFIPEILVLEMTNLLGR